MSPEKAYDDLTLEELADEIAGLDQEIEDYQNSLSKLRKNLRDRLDLREALIEISTRRNQVKGWQRKYA